MRMYKKFFEGSKKDLRVKVTFDGQFKVFNFFNKENEYIGHIHLRLKKGWNQVHIEVEEKFRSLGYSYDFLNYVIGVHNYVSLPEGRVVNKLVFKIIDFYKKNKNYDVFVTDLDEWIISNKKIKKEKILDIFK